MGSNITRQDVHHCSDFKAWDKENLQNKKITRGLGPDGLFGVFWRLHFFFFFSNSNLSLIKTPRQSRTTNRKEKSKKRKKGNFYRSLHLLSLSQP